MTVGSSDHRVENVSREDNEGQMMSRMHWHSERAPLTHLVVQFKVIRDVADSNDDGTVTASTVEISQHICRTLDLSVDIEAFFIFFISEHRNLCLDLFVMVD